MNFVREKLKKQNAVCGVWSIVESPTLTEIIALSNFDFQIFDMEHGSYDFGTLENAIRTSENNGCSPFVRISGMDSVATQKALDFGAHGIIYPQVQDQKGARLAVEMTKYAPVGTRGYNPFTRADNYSITKKPGRNQNDFSITSIIIENKSSFLDLDRILDTDALELFYLGAYDMSVALGCPGDMTNPNLIAFMETCIKKIVAKKKFAGVMAQTPQAMKEYINMGAKFVVLGVDSNLIGKSLLTATEQFSKLL